MKNQLQVIAALFMLLAGAETLAADSIYSWTDDTGRVHYGDKKPEDKTVETLDLSTAPSIKPVAEDEMLRLLPGRWLRNLGQGRGKESLHFRRNQRVTGALLLGGEALQEFRGTWRLIDGWMVLEIMLFNEEQQPEREVSFAITELTEYTLVQTARDGSKQYWYFTGRR
ncbi:MAG TPA: DUF4124 domain-containing protein [Marinobacter sp.]|nr:DUF4124 domain-containing protein [Marinobacter sp.]